MRLRRLPVTSLAARQDSCPDEEALGALSQAVDKESLRERENGVDETKMIDICWTCGVQWLKWLGVASAGVFAFADLRYPFCEWLEKLI